MKRMIIHSQTGSGKSLLISEIVAASVDGLITQTDLMLPSESKPTESDGGKD